LRLVDASKCVCSPGPCWGAYSFTPGPLAGFGGGRNGEGGMETARK